MHTLVTRPLRSFLLGAIAVGDRAKAKTGRPFDEPDVMVPHLDSKRFGWTHYGVMIPDLPEPHRFLSVMSLVGATGSLAFDNDETLAGQPRRNASVVAGTAASYPDHHGDYAFGETFHAAPDGSDIAFGDDLRLRGRYPDYSLTGLLGGVEVDLTLTNTDKVSWFFRSPLYKHFSLLTDYRGTLTVDGDVTEVAGLCAFEYGACPSPYLATAKPLPTRFKAPLDYFVYHIVNLDEDHQILLSQYSIGGRPLMTTALFRGRDQYGQWFDDVRFTVTGMRGEPEPTPYGEPMPMPESTRFEVRDARGAVWLVLDTTMDTPWTFGLGSGFVSGFGYTGTWRGEPIDGRGYVEYIDRRS